MPAALSRVQTQISALVSGLYGDWLADRGNALALPMQFLHGEDVLDTTQPALSSPRSTLVVFAHGLMGSESIWEFPKAPGQSYASTLECALPSTCIFLRYNSGRAVSENGSDLSHGLESMAASWPTQVRRIILIGHSMGGLLIRSAAHHAVERGYQWIDCLQQCIYIGTPHDGSWFARGAESAARLLQQMPRDYLRLAGEFIDRRSQGIRNLANGDVVDKAAAAHPLPRGVEHYSVSGSLGKSQLHLPTRAFGDGMVHEPSARGGAYEHLPWTGHASFPGLGHLRLAHDPAVAKQLTDWLI